MKKYFIVESSFTDFASVAQNSFETCRKNETETHIVVSLDNDEETPASLTGIQSYTHEEILVKMQEDEWIDKTFIPPDEP